MAVHNAEIAAIFNKLADLLEIEGANPFRVSAYRNAARTITEHPRSMASLLKSGEDLTELPGIGDDLAGKIKTIVDTGKLPLLKEVESRTPGVLSDLMKIEGLGPKRVKALYQQLKIRSFEDLKRAARRGEIQKLSGFGEKTEQLIKDRLERFSGEEARTKLVVAEGIAEPLVDYLRQCKGIDRVVVAGSFRRRKETVGDLDILVTATAGASVIDRFVAYDEVEEIISQGSTRSTVRLRCGLNIDLRVVAKSSYGAALYYFTGSKAHNVAVRRMAVKRGYKINEYGVYKNNRKVAGRTEEEIFKCVDLPYIEPELRENRGELEVARDNKLPTLITQEDIRGDLHCHTEASDGHNTLEQMAQAAIELGYEYISINDHSKHVTIAHGLDKKRLLQQIDAIDQLNGKLSNFRILKSVELDILDDGSLDLPDDILKELDFTVCALHYKFGLSREKQTERILRAFDNPYCNILAHPSGRLINEREAYDIDLEKVMQAAKECGCYLEVNAHPDRLDLTDEACLAAKQIGVKLAISTDAHSTAGLGNMRFGIGQARRGWISADDVINTQPLDQLLSLLKRNQ